jgi:hypothetical protein
MTDLMHVAMSAMGNLEITATQPPVADLEHRMEGGQEFKINLYNTR